MNRNFEDLSKEDLYEQGELFLDCSDGLRFIDFCDHQDLAVIGIEGGKYEDIFTPDVNLIQDYSSLNAKNWIEFRLLCNSKARTFLQQFADATEFRFYLVFIKEIDMALSKSNDWKSRS